MASLTVKEVKTISDFFYRDGILLSVVFEDKLFQVQECPFMRNFLSDLNHGFPGVFSSQFCAIRTLTVLNEILDLKNLFQDRVRQNLN